jgi:uncharacterized caspase-like protein
MTKNLLILLAGVLGLSSTVCPAQSQPAVRGLVVDAAAPFRRALIIGNANYAGAAPLQNTINDARSVATTLGGLDFQVQKGENLDGVALERAINTFVDGIGAGDVALFYYSGHGMELNRENYLVPVDFQARDEAEARRQAYSANLLLDKLEARKPRMTIVILDACRNNPFGRTRGGGGGLATMDAGAGVYIAFATAPGRTASDNPGGENGLFTGQLVQALTKPDMDLNQVFDEVRAGVSGASGGTQVPWSVSSVIGRFVFRDITSQQKKVQAELARLEAELASLNKERSTAQGAAADRQRREAEQRAAELEQRLRLQRLEEERLAKEADRRKSLEAEQQRLVEQFNPNNPERQRQRQVEESNIAELRRKLDIERTATAEAKMGTFTLAMARQEVIAIRQKLDSAKLSVDEQKRQAIQKLDQDYAPVRQAAAITLTKDTFESTEEFQDRVKKQSDEKMAVDAKYRNERAAIERRYSEEATSEAGLFQKQISAIQSHRYITPDVKPQSVTYDADTGVFTLRVENEPFYLQMDRDHARELYARKDLLSVDLTLPYYDSGAPKLPQEIHLKDPGSGQSYTPERNFILKVSSAPAPSVEVGRHPVVQARLRAASGAMASGDYTNALTYFTEVLQAGGSIPLPLLHYDHRFMWPLWLHQATLSLNLTSLYFDPDGADWQAGGWKKCSQAAFTVPLADVRVKLFLGDPSIQITAKNPAKSGASLNLNFMDVSATVSYSKYLPDNPGMPDLTVAPTFASRPGAKEALSTIFKLLGDAIDRKIQYTGGLPYQPPEAR